MCHIAAAVWKQEMQQKPDALQNDINVRVASHMKYFLRYVPRRCDLGDLIGVPRVDLV